jgi:hypothetical protein
MRATLPRHGRIAAALYRRITCRSPRPFARDHVRRARPEARITGGQT